MISTADFLANVLANVGGTVAPIETIHYNGFDNTDSFAVGGVALVSVSFDGFHGALRWAPIAKVNRASVVVDIDGHATRIPVGRVYGSRAA